MDIFLSILMIISGVAVCILVFLLAMVIILALIFVIGHLIEAIRDILYDLNG